MMRSPRGSAAWVIVAHRRRSAPPARGGGSGGRHGGIAGRRGGRGRAPASPSTAGGRLVRVRRQAEPQPRGAGSRTPPSKAGVGAATPVAGWRAASLAPAALHERAGRVLSAQPREQPRDLVAGRSAAPDLPNARVHQRRRPASSALSRVAARRIAAHDGFVRRRGAAQRRTVGGVGSRGCLPAPGAVRSEHRRCALRPRGAGTVEQRQRGDDGDCREQDERGKMGRWLMAISTARRLLRSSSDRRALRACRRRPARRRRPFPSCRSGAPRG